MTYEEALTVLKRGGKVTRGGKTFVLRSRGVHDVTDENNPVRVYMSEEDRTGTNWESPEAVSPEVVDEVLGETTIPETLDSERPQ